MGFIALSHALKLDTKGEISQYDNDPQSEVNFIQRIKENRLFKHLSIIPTDYFSGNAMGLYMPFAGHTDTKQVGRQPKLALSPVSEYACQQMNVDAYLLYTRIDAHNLENDLKSHFDGLLADSVMRSLLMVGFNGNYRTGISSNADENPLAEDVQSGWLRKIREQGTRLNCYLRKASIGKTGEYKNINALIKHGLSQITPHYAGAGDMVVICGRDIIADDIIQSNHSDLTEDLGDFMTLCQNAKGGLKAISVPYFPTNSILITRLDNLAIYYQKGTLRKTLIDEAKWDRIKTYTSLNLDFIVEDFNACYLVDNIVFKDDK